MPRKRREIGGDLHRLQELDAVEVIFGRTAMPVTSSQVADHLGVPVERVRLSRLLRAGCVLKKPLPSGIGDGFVPRVTSHLDVGAALESFSALPNRTERVVVDGRTPHGRNRVEGGRERKLTMSSALRSHVTRSMERACEVLGLEDVSKLESRHLPFLADAAWVGSMRATPLPECEWGSSASKAEKARRNADKRRSEIRLFLAFAENEGLLSVGDPDRALMDRDWAEFVALSPIKEKDARELVAKAIELGAYSPEALVELGFDRLEAMVVKSDRYSSSSSARSSVSRCRTAWNRRARVSEYLPMWAGRRPLSARRSDGGLELTWWSVPGVIRGDAPLLDEPEMQLQKAEAIDLIDWSRLHSPEDRAEDEGGPLPPRPKKAGYGKQLGSRDENPQVADRALRAVSRYQRYLLTEAPSSDRLTVEELRSTPWIELFADRPRLLRFLDHEVERLVAANDGRMTKGSVWNSLVAAFTLLWAYFPAYIKRELEAIRTKINKTIWSAENEEALRGLEADRRRLDGQLQEWEQLADRWLSRLRSLEEKYGFVSRKPKSEIATKLSHDLILGRLAARLRSKRLDFEEDMRVRTETMQAERKMLLLEPCEVHAARSCGVCFPEIELTSTGFAVSLVNRGYCITVTREAMFRLGALLPWRPGVFRKALIGEHLDPESLAVAAVGNDNKVQRDNGQVRRMRVTLPELPSVTYPDEVEHAVEVIRVLIRDAQPWLWNNPTKTGRRLQKPAHRKRMFLSREGAPFLVESRFGGAIRSALESTARELNRLARAPEDMVELPSGWGARASYIFRFLWGHRALSLGVDVGVVAQVLGNSPETVLAYYHDVDQGEAMQQAAAHMGKRGDVDPRELALLPPDETAGSPGPSTSYESELRGLLEDRRAGRIDDEEYQMLKVDLKLRYGRAA